MRMLNEQMCVGADNFLRTGLRQPVQPYAHQLTNAFPIELCQQGNMVG